MTDRRAAIRIADLEAAPGGLKIAEAAAEMVQRPLQGRTVVGSGVRHRD